MGAMAQAAPTGVNAHYRFADVAPGAYILWAETQIGDHHYTWWAPIRVAPGDSLSRDLDNSVEANAELYCGEERVAVLRTVLAEDSARRAEQLAADAPKRQREREREREGARRGNWEKCYAYATFATEIAECSRKWLTTHADSEWAQKEYSGGVGKP